MGSLAGEQAALEARHRRRHFQVGQERAHLVGRMPLQVGVELAQPELDRAAGAGRVIFEIASRRELSEQTWAIVGSMAVPQGEAGALGRAASGRCS